VKRRALTARIAIFSWGGGSRHEDKTHDAHPASTFARAPGTWARRGNSAAGLIFLSVGNAASTRMN
jgi:hypothetical protein